MTKKLQKCLEQVLHFTWAFIVTLPIILWNEWWAFGIMAFVLAAPREFVDQWPINKWWDTALDLGFFILGGLTAGLLLT